MKKIALLALCLLGADTPALAGVHATQDELTMSMSFLSHLGKGAQARSKMKSRSRGREALSLSQRVNSIRPLDPADYTRVEYPDGPYYERFGGGFNCSADSDTVAFRRKPCVINGNAITIQPDQPALYGYSHSLFGVVGFDGVPKTVSFDISEPALSTPGTHSRAIGYVYNAVTDNYDIVFQKIIEGATTQHITVPFPKPSLDGYFIVYIDQRIDDSPVTSMPAYTISNIVFDYPEDFKVTLNGKEYLFDDCAPNNDSCKDLKADYKAGEFLVGDRITLSASDMDEDPQHPITSIHWKITNLSNSNIPPVNLDGTVANYELPLEGDYEVSLSVVRDGPETFPLGKRLKARSGINVTYSAPGPFFMHKNISTGPNDYSLGLNWGSAKRFGQGTESSHGYNNWGCAVTSVSNLSWRQFNLGPMETDQLLRNSDVYLDNDQVIFPEIARAWNSLESLGEKRWNYVEYDNDLDLASEAARKRKHQILEVNLHPGNPAKPQRHYVALSGISFGGVLGITDPQDDNRKFINLSPYFGAFQGVRALEKQTSIPPLINPRIYASTSTTKLNFSQVRINSKNYKITADHKGNRAFEQGIVTLEAIGNGGENDDGSTSGGYMLSIPQGSEGAYSVDISALTDTLGTVELKVFNSNNQVNLNRTIPISLGAGQIKTISFDVTNQNILNGTITVNGASSWVDPTSRKSMTSIKGVFLPGAGSNGIPLVGEDLDFSVAGANYILPAGAFDSVAGIRRYVNAAAPSGIRSFTVHEDNGFSLEISGIDFTKSSFDGSTSLEARLGDDRLTGSIDSATVRSPPMMSLSLDRAASAGGERVSGKMLANIRPKDAEQELYMIFKIDDQPNLVTSITDTSWAFRSSRLSSGTHAVSANLFLQNKRLAAQTRQGTAAFRARISEIEGKLKIETDPEIIAELQQEKQALIQKIDQLEYHLSQSRTAVGESLSDQILVH